MKSASFRPELSGLALFNRPSSGAACVFPSDYLPTVDQEQCIVNLKAHIVHSVQSISRRQDPPEDQQCR
jgi:hypothetical protein